MALQGLLDHLGPMVPKVHKVYKDPQDSQDHQVRQECLIYRLDVVIHCQKKPHLLPHHQFMVHQVLLASLDHLDLLDHEEEKGYVVELVMQVFQENDFLNNILFTEMAQMSNIYKNLMKKTNV